VVTVGRHGEAGGSRVTTPNVEEPVPFGVLLRQNRVAAGLTQEALAERTGLGVRSIQHLEAGEHLPHRETVARLIRALVPTGEERRLFERLAQPTIRPLEAASIPRGGKPGNIVRHRAPRQNLPAPLTSFVGREQEMDDVKRLLEAHRLVTLTGTGGCGKTRLALHVAAELVDQFPDGVWLVELAPLADPNLVGRTIAAAVDIQERPDRPLRDTLVDALRSRRLLLILDNCEHVIETCARLADALLRGCPDLRILGTSREALGVDGEVPWRVPSLRTPPHGQLPADKGDPAALTRFESVHLFVERARLADLDFAVTPQNARALARICWRLDGIPLAIELAAPQVRMLSMERIEERLDDQFRLLTGGSRTALPRQQTLRATTDWSYKLLSETERALFNRLAVFAGGWTLEAAEEICSDSRLSPADVLSELTQLVDKSMVVVEKSGDEARFRLQEALRQYATEKLQESGELVDLRERHAKHFLAIAEQAGQELRGSGQIPWVRRLDREHDNLRAALSHWDARGDLESGARLAGSLWRYWWYYGHQREGRRRLDRILEPLGRPALIDRTTTTTTRIQTSTWAFALHAAGVLDLMTDDLALAREHLGHAIVLWRELGNKRATAESLHWLFAASFFLGDYVDGRRLIVESLALSRELGDEWNLAEALPWLGWLNLTEGNLPAARDAYTQAALLARKVGDQAHLGWALAFFGFVALAEGNAREARDIFTEGRDVLQEVGNRHLFAHALAGLGVLDLDAARFSAAHAQLTEALEILAEIGDQVGIALILEFHVSLAAEQAQWNRALRIGGAASAVRRQGGPVTLGAQEMLEQALAQAREALGERESTAAWTEGLSMTVDQAVELAGSVGAMP
jgi:predicted ATPase/transcriptional regulator with XRE-family HTH domain